MAVAGGDVFLHERHVVEAEFDLVGFGRGFEFFGESKRTMPAPLPPTLAFTTTGKRSPRAAAGASIPRWMTRERGAGSPRSARSVSCNALETSYVNALLPLITRAPTRSRWARKLSVCRMALPLPRR